MEVEKKQNISSEVICVFKTNLAEKYQIDEDQQYTVKTNFTEKNLNELVSHILEEENPMDEDEQKTLPSFEFLINGEFLRGNIKSHLIKHGISTEKNIVINYTFGLNKPSEGKKVDEEDWISHICLNQGYKADKKSGFVASLFNGDLTFYDKNMNLQLRQNIVEDIAVKQSIVTQYKNYDDIVISACQDDTIRVGSYSYKNKTYTPVTECVGNESSVNCLDINPLLPQQFCAGSYDGKLSLYNLADSDLKNAAKQSNENDRKKVKLEKKVVEPLQQHKQHTDNITKVAFKNQNQVYSSSLDHSVKLFDFHKVAQAGTLSTKDSAVTAFAFKDELIITGHEDSYIKTYDFRENNLKAGATNIFKSHSLWISDIQLLPTNDNIFISSSYDHSIKMWDLRSSFPVCTMKSHHDKIFSIQWNGDSQILSGGSDKTIASHDFNNQMQEQQKQ